LADVVVDASILDHADEDLPPSQSASWIESRDTYMVRLPRNLNTLRSNFAEDADRYAGAGERLIEKSQIPFADTRDQFANA
jgi:hypothetical protein